MKNRITAAILPAIAASCVLVTSCQMSQYSTTLTRSHLGASGITQDESDTFQGLEKTGSIQVTLHAECTGGSLGWKLTDPAGAVRWQGRIDGGSLDVEQVFQTIAGPWLLDTSLVDYSGSYRFAMHAQGGRQLRIELAPGTE